ncbi:MAG: hypothetical protein ACRC4M_03940, partial [Mycoplasma sp.]
MKYCIKTDLTIEKNKLIHNELVSFLSDWEQVEDGFKYLFIIGGDGSFLKHANQYLMKDDLKVILINSGNLGFYSYTSNVKDIKMEDILDESNYITLDLLETTYKGVQYFSINDFSYYSNFTSEIRTYINNELLQTIHGNGMLVATPFGSTARNKSLGGAIIMPNSNTNSIIEIEAINNRSYKSLNSPIVISNQSTIRFETSNYRDASLLFDGTELKINDSHSVID